ncbi:hypothetical protein LF817_06665 [Halobacillus sp. A1]|uniref:hypothetical protein n=1 Tax=Halobacillus sp. A1 TaxID=2880262 RepID=UPI0020A6B914|nr:hypothetical protein [Halobacillus sp. A1]MCP3031023.1 hypothetical protein [Halobacillus sp. A1]
MNSFNIYLSLLSVVLLTACSFIIADANDQKASSSQKKEPYEITTKEETERIEEYHVSIDYPQTPNDQIDQSIIDFVNQSKEKFKKISYKAHEKQNSEVTHEFSVSYDVLYEDEHVFVVKFNQSILTGDNSPVNFDSVLNFDKSKGKRLALEDIFTKDEQHVKHLTELVNEELSGRAELSVDAENFTNVALKGDRIEIHLPSDSGAEEDLIKISKIHLEDMMRSKYAEVQKSWLKEK